jgi:hypothetical protein
MSLTDAEGRRLVHAHPAGIGWVELEGTDNGVPFVASDEPRYITGVTLPVDGGSCPKSHRHFGSGHRDLADEHSFGTDLGT